MSEWQPIETAPKDGSDFLMCRFGEEVCPTYGVIWFDDSNAKFPWRIVDSDTGYHKDFPTHWMPLEPPK